LLDYLLEANTLTPNQLDEFIQVNHDEGQYFDYKDGKITTQPHHNKVSQTIREYISGFANSDGGVLLIGVNDSTPRHIAPCEAFIGTLPVDQWASGCLHGMVGYF
jgi:schlafen family protein